MNFNSYLPSKLLGSTLLVSNISECEQIIELSVDSNNYKYNKNDIIKQFPGVLSKKKDLNNRA